MISYLTESTISLLLLLGVYYLLLATDKSHHFNRFYLLFSVLFSLIIPLINIEIIKEIVVEKKQLEFFEPTQFNKIIVQETFSYNVYFWVLYIAITICFAFKFIKNILHFKNKIKNNESINYQNATIILVNEKTVPYTFLNYIFVNNDDYLQQKIETELLTHELAHVSQKHSFDILFLELLKTVFWFNPVLILYKKAIQLNHEFIADDAVVKKCNAIYGYQNLLISKSSFKTDYNLASSINYKVTKKRLIMMTKTKPNGFSIFKKAVLIPIISGLIFSFCIEIIAQESSTLSNSKSTISIDEKDKIRDVFYAKVQIEIIDVSNKIKINKVYEDLTLAEKRKYLDYLPSKINKKSPTEKEFLGFKNSKKYAVWIDDVYVTNSKLDNYKASDFVYFSCSNVLKNAKSKKFPQPFQYNLYTNSFYEKNLANSHLKFSGKSLTLKVGSFKHSKFIKNLKRKKEDLDLNNIITTPNEKTFVNPEKPSFPGGISAFYDFFAKNFKLTDDYKGSGKIIMRFMVETDGRLTEITATKDIGFGLGDEAKRVLLKSPNWIPAKLNDKPVRMQYVLPISIQQ